MKSLDRKDRVLDSKLALSLIGSESPNDLIVNNEEITRIGNLCDVPFVRKLNISFNNIFSLDGIDQLPQLRTLYAYSCSLENVSILQNTAKLEVLFLQDNKICKLVPSFTMLTKLQHLRLDNNRIAVIENLQCCSNLKILDLSRNSISLVEPLNGLQNLTELHLNNNNISSVSSLRALPNLKELDLSHNSIKAVDFGVIASHIPSLEVLNLNHNVISMLVCNIQTSSSKKKAVSSATTSSSKAMSQLPATQSFKLLELYLSGNRVRSITALECLRDSIEILDLSNNSLSGSADKDDLVVILCKFEKLTELRLNNNDCCAKSDYMNNLVTSVTESCKDLTAIDGLSIVHNVGSATDNQWTAASSGQRLETDDQDSATELFHTWEIGADSQHSLVAEDSVVNTLLPQRKVSRAVYVHSDSEDSGGEDTDDDKDEGKEEETNVVVPGVVSDERWRLKPMVSEEVIQQRENNIRGLLSKCKDTLSLVTVFNMMTYEEREQQELQRNQPKVEDFAPSASITAVAVKSKVESLLDNYSVEQLGQHHSSREASSVITRAPLLTVEGVIPTHPVDSSITTSKARRFAEHKQESIRQEEAMLSPRQPQDPVCIAMPKLESSEVPSSTAAAEPVVEDSAPQRVPYKPLLHSSMRTAASSSSSSLKSNPSTGSASDIAPAVSVDDGSVLDSTRSTISKSSAATDKTGVISKKSKSKSSSVSTSSGLLSSGGMSAAERFSSEIAKLGAPTGSGLSRHGTKAKASMHSNRSTTKSNVNNTGDMRGDSLSTNADPSSPNSMRIAKREAKQYFLDSGASGSSIGGGGTLLSDAKGSNSDSTQDSVAGEASIEPVTEKEATTHAVAEVKVTGRFAQKIVTLDTRAVPGSGVSLFEQYHNMHADTTSATTTLMVNNKDKSIMNPSSIDIPTAAADNYLPSSAPADDDSPLDSYSPLSLATSTGTSFRHQSHSRSNPGSKTPTSNSTKREAFHVFANIPQPVPPNTNSYKKFKIPQEARSAITGSGTTSSRSDDTTAIRCSKSSDTLNLSALEAEILRLSESSVSDSSLAYSVELSPRPLRSAGHL